MLDLRSTQSIPRTSPPRIPRARRWACMLAALPALLGSTAPAANGKVTIPERSRFHLFLLVGQSNMAGRGDIEPADREPIPNVLALDAKGEWVPAVDPLHWDKPNAGVGLARSFAVEYLRTHPGVTVGLIPAAHGGSPISVWQPGQYFDETHGHPYDDALARARLALKSGTLHAILWHQGESDRGAERAPKYEAALTELIARFRHDLAAPQVPFVIGQLGQFPGAGPWDDFAKQVDRAQRDVVLKVPQTAFVSSDGLSSKPDNLHFNAPSLREFGKRYAASLAALEARAKHGTHAPAAGHDPAQH